MPSLISATEKANLTGVFNDIFETFQRSITVYKEPTKVAQQVNSNNFVYGFGDSQAQDAYTYVDVTGVYPATIRYKNENSWGRVEDANIVIPHGGCSIKVKRDARDFINNGKTDKVVVDEKTYYLDGDEVKRMFLDSEFWIFVLKPTR